METSNYAEEIEAYHFVRDLLENGMSSRVSMSDAKTYLAIIMDNNSHKTICRLYFNAKVKYIGTISDRKVETRTPIDDIQDIAAFRRQLNDRAKRFLNK